MSVFLIGYRGSGKSVVGEQLAAMLNWPLRDTDDLVVQRAGATIASIFRDQGETAFRELESDALKQVVGERASVISTGGGIIIREDNRRVLRSAGGTIVYLRCSPEELYRRISADHRTAANRPSLTALGGGLEEVAGVLEGREPLYREIADLVIDTHNRSVAQVAREIQCQLQDRRS